MADKNTMKADAIYTGIYISINTYSKIYILIFNGIQIDESTDIIHLYYS